MRRFFEERVEVPCPVLGHGDSAWGVAAHRDVNGAVRGAVYVGSLHEDDFARSDTGPAAQAEEGMGRDAVLGRLPGSSPAVQCCEVPTGVRADGAFSAVGGGNHRVRGERLCELSEALQVGPLGGVGPADAAHPPLHEGFVEQVAAFQRGVHGEHGPHHVVRQGRQECCSDGGGAWPVLEHARDDELADGIPVGGGGVVWAVFHESVLHAPRVMVFELTRVCYRSPCLGSGQWLRSHAGAMRGAARRL